DAPVAGPAADRGSRCRRLRAVRSRRNRRRLRASPAPRKTSERRRKRAFRERTGRPRTARRCAAAARAAAVARRGDARIQAGPGGRWLVSHGGQRTVLGIAAARHRRRRRFSAPRLPARDGAAAGDRSAVRDRREKPLARRRSRPLAVEAVPQRACAGRSARAAEVAGGFLPLPVLPPPPPPPGPPP